MPKRRVQGFEHRGDLSRATRKIRRDTDDKRDIRVMMVSVAVRHVFIIKKILKIKVKLSI